MKLFNIIVIPCDSAGDFYSKFKKRMILHSVIEGVKLVLIVGIAVFILLETMAPIARKSLQIDFPVGIKQFLSFVKSGYGSNAKEVLNLAQMIRLITDDQLSEAKALRYAGLISHASQRFGVDPLEIIAIIMAESGFKENSVNKETGDYGLGQVNWEHWGKDYGYTRQQLLDPSINIYLTCHVYKFFGEDFGKYHRGNGIQCKAYVVNVKSILSTLNAFGQLKKEKVS
ncbi:MAG: transglycosylase SLT domain-containing protein [Thermodesulfobacteriota bacterium]